MLHTTLPPSAEQQASKALREEIRQAANREEALQRISGLDGNDSLPAIIQITDELIHLYNQEIDALLAKMLTPDELVALTNPRAQNDESSDAFKKYAHDIIQPFKDETKIKTRDLNAEFARKFSSDMLAFIQKKNKALMAGKVLSADQVALIQKFKMEVFLLCANTVFKRADWEQRQNPIEVVKKYAGPALKSIFASYEIRDLIESRYKMVNLLCEVNLKVDDNKVMLCDELALWLEGLYLRTDRLYTQAHRDEHGAVKKDKQGNYIPRPEDDQDKSLYKYGLTKYYMSLYYKSLSVTIRNSLVPFESSRKLFYKAPVQPDLAAKSDLSTAIQSVLDGAKPVPVKDAVVVEAPAGDSSLASVSGGVKSVQPAASAPINISSAGDGRRVLELGRQASFSSVADSPGGLFYRKLSGHRGKSADEKITQLQRCLFSDSPQMITDEVLNDLNFTLSRLKQVADAYKQNAGYLQKKRNLDIAVKILGVIDDVDLSSSQKLFRIIGERSMLKERQSADLLPELDKELLTLFDNLTELDSEGLHMQVNVRVGVGMQ